MEGTIPTGSLVSGIFWIFILILLPIAAFIFLKEYKKSVFGENKKSLSDIEKELQDQFKESYKKLSEDQKRKIDNIK